LLPKTLPFTLQGITYKSIPPFIPTPRIGCYHPKATNSWRGYPMSTPLLFVLENAKMPTLRYILLSSHTLFYLSHLIQ
jgi:hypothetical protein